MANLIWALSCQRAIIDRETNSLSLIDHFEGLTLATLPARREDGALPLIPLRFAVVSYWTRSADGIPETVELRIRLVDPSGASHAQGTTMVDLQSSHAARSVVTFPGLPISGAGNYTLELARKVGEKWAVEEASPRVRVIVSDCTQAAAPEGPRAEAPKRRRKK